MVKKLFKQLLECFVFGLVVAIIASTIGFIESDSIIPVISGVMFGGLVDWGIKARKNKDIMKYNYSMLEEYKCINFKKFILKRTRNKTTYMLI